MLCVRKIPTRLWMVLWWEGCACGAPRVVVLVRAVALLRSTSDLVGMNESDAQSELGAVPAPVKLAPPVDWWRLDAAQRVETLDVVSRFTVQLVRSYGLSAAVVPPCWFEHEAVVVELLALFQYRNQQQFLEVAPPGAPQEWHVQFERAVVRLRQWTTNFGCTEQEHRPTRLPGWVVADTASAEAYETNFEQFAARMLQGSLLDTGEKVDPNSGVLIGTNTEGK